MKDALANVDEKQLDRVQAIIRGMTPAERDDPKIINASRRLRIANGSGVKVSDVNQLVDRFFEARKMMAAMAGRMGMPGSRKQQRSKKGKKGKKGGKGPTPPKVRGGFPRRSARRVPWNAARRSSRGDAGFVEHAEGPGRIAARTRGHRPVPAEAAEEVADGCTALPGGPVCPTNSRSSSGSTAV